VFTGRYALSPYIKQTRFVFKGLIEQYVRGGDSLPVQSIYGRWALCGQKGVRIVFRTIWWPEQRSKESSLESSAGKNTTKPNASRQTPFKRKVPLWVNLTVPVPYSIKLLLEVPKLNLDLQGDSIGRRRGSICNVIETATQPSRNQLVWNTSFWTRMGNNLLDGTKMR
jgi:hypothetical protein